MHGRVKVRTDAEKAAVEEKKNEEKAAKFRAGVAAVFQMRKDASQDESALQLTAQLLSANPDFYTLWNYRREILNRFKQRVSSDKDAGDADVLTEEQFDAMCQKELDLSASCLLNNPKSYPSWYQRTFVLRTMFHPDFDNEIRLCTLALQKDCRNFHCWNHRRFVVQVAGIDMQKEIDFTEAKIRENFSNFSSWFQRSALLTQAAVHNKSNISQIWDSEYKFVENAIFTDPTDQSAWFYHKWLSSIQMGEAVATNDSPPSDLFIEQIVWNRARSLLVIRFNRALESFPEMNVLFSGTTAQPFVEACNRNTGELCTSFYMTAVSGEAVTIEFGGSRFVIEGDADIVVRQKNFVESDANPILKPENLKNLKQLLELEPDNKWVNLALTPFAADIQSSMKTLAQIDPCRKNHYKDLASDERLSHMVNSLGLSCSAAIRGQHLTRISLCHKMSHLRFLDLSKNDLKILTRAFNDLYCLETLLMTDNHVSLIAKGFEVCSLRSLSLINNKIRSSQVLDRLASCPNLELVYLCGNPCTRVPCLMDKVLNWEDASPNLSPDEIGSPSIQPLQITQ